MRRNHTKLQKNKDITSSRVHQVHEDFSRRLQNEETANANNSLGDRFKGNKEKQKAIMLNQKLKFWILDRSLKKKRAPASSRRSQSELPPNSHEQSLASSYQEQGRLNR